MKPLILLFGLLSPIFISAINVLDSDSQQSVLTRDSLLLSSWSGNTRRIVIDKTKISIEDPVTKYEAYFPYRMTNDSIIIMFDEKLFSGTYLLKDDS